jgi:hypothetical protein
MDIKIVLAVVGGRNFSDYALLKKELDLFTQSNIVTKIVSGGAKGADSLAEKYAKDNNLEILIFKPDWNKYGKAAGIIRNEDIIRESTHIIAFWDKKSTGTKNSIDRAIKANKSVKIINY